MTQNSTPTRLVEYINLVFDNAHGHQRNAMVDFVMSKQLRKVMSRRKKRGEMSLMRAMAELISKDGSCWDVLDHRLKLNLLAVL